MKRRKKAAPKRAPRAPKLRALDAKVLAMVEMGMTPNEDDLETTETRVAASLKRLEAAGFVYRREVWEPCVSRPDAPAYPAFGACMAVYVVDDLARELGIPWPALLRAARRLGVPCIDGQAAVLAAAKAPLKPEGEDARRVPGLIVLTRDELVPAR